MKATIYYNMLPHPAENKFAGKMWTAVRKEDTVKMSDVQFKKYWKKMPVKEKTFSLEKLFVKYNMYSTNPYSDENDPGQKMLKKIGVRHTSMMIGDIIEIDNTYYMVASEGFSEVSIE